MVKIREIDKKIFTIYVVAFFLGIIVDFGKSLLGAYFVENHPYTSVIYTSLVFFIFIMIMSGVILLIVKNGLNKRRIFLSILFWGGERNKYSRSYIEYAPFCFSMTFYSFGIIPFFFIPALLYTHLELRALRDIGYL